MQIRQFRTRCRGFSIDYDRFLFNRIPPPSLDAVLSKRFEEEVARNCYAAARKQVGMKT